MNDKDKAVFVKYMGENLPYSYYVSYRCSELKTWESACEYKQKEIFELTGQLKSCIFVYEEKVNRLIAENKKLREALEFYADFKNWRTVTVSKSNQRFCILTGADLEYFKEPNQDSYCGKRAREALKEVGEE